MNYINITKKIKNELKNIINYIINLINIINK